MSNYLTLANSIIGASILAMPYCFSKVSRFMSVLEINLVSNSIFSILTIAGLLVWNYFINLTTNHQYIYHKIMLQLSDKSKYSYKT